MNKNNYETEFDYSNLSDRASGPFVRIGAKVHKGIRGVQSQVVPYAEAWQRHNLEAVKASGPLWVVIGDSMSQGIGATEYNRGWVGQLNKQLQATGQHYRIINLSISGARIADVLERQLPALESLGQTPDLVTVMIGSNDLVRKKYRVHALADFKKLLARVPAGSIVSNLLGGSTVPRAMDHSLDLAVHERGLVIADLRRDGPKNWKGKVAEDFFHPNEDGYAEIAAVFAKALQLPNVAKKPKS